MPKEHPAYRDQLESIITHFPQKECLTVCEVAEYCGYSEKTVAKRFPFIGHGRSRYITRTVLARELVNSK